MNPWYRWIVFAGPLRLHINETYGVLMAQLKAGVMLIKLERNQTTEEQEKLTEVLNSFLPKHYRKNIATPPRSERFIGAIAALGADAVSTLGDPLKEAACTVISTFDLREDTSSLSKDVEDSLETQKETLATLHCV